MPATLYIFWERRRLCGLIADTENSRAQIRHTFVIPWADDSDPLQFPTKSAETLRQQIAGSSANPTRTVLCLSREDVILRHLTVPDVPDDELPDLVRFQAAARSATSLDQLLLDFLPLPKPAGHEGRPVLAITVPKTLVQGIQSILLAAGQENVQTVTFSSVGLAELLAHQPGLTAHSAAINVVRDGARVELVILSDRRLLYAHSARLVTDDAGLTPLSGLYAEVSRTIVAAQRLHPQLQIQRATLVDASAEQSAVLSGLAERLNVAVEPLQLTGLNSVTPPKDWPQHPAPEAILLGTVLSDTQRLTPGFDFLHPRQPPTKINPRKLQLAVASAAALLLAALLMSYVELTRAGLQRELDRLITQESELDVKISAGKTPLNAAKLVDDWQLGNVNQISQFTELENLMEGTERIYFSTYDFTAGQGEIQGSLKAAGNAKSIDEIKFFNQRLTDTKRYRIQPKQLSQTSRDDEYPSRFELHAEILPPPKPVKALPEK